jgi:hypothetical protein
VPAEPAEPAEWVPVVTRPDWMTGEDLRASLDAVTAEDEPWWLEEGDPDPLDDDPPGEYDLREIAAQCRQAAEDQARAAANAARLGLTGAMAAVAALNGRRGPGQPGSAEVFPGEYRGRAAQFASGMLFDVMPGRPELAGFADAAAGPDDCFGGACDDEVLGVLCAWDRVEAHAAARKHAAVAELMRRRPAPGCVLEGPARMPAACDEFTASELTAVLAVSRWDADAMLALAHDLEVKLPGTKAAFLDGILSETKAEIIARATLVLDAEEARAAEALVLGRAGRLTPAGLRSAIARAVIEVAPDKATRRREQAARQARVQRWAEASGNAALEGRELPQAGVIAADQRIGWWARQLKKAGLDGSMDELRARAYLDLLLGTDSRPRQDAAGGPEGGAGRGGPGGSGPGGGGSGPPDRPGPATPPGTGVLPAGFAGTVQLTVPLATLLGLAERPAEIPGLGPVDPALARDLANAAVRNPKTTWCVTVTDEQGHAIGHGCARPEPRSHQEHREKHRKPGPRDGRDPPGGTGARDGPGFAFTATGEHGPPGGGGTGGYGTWRLHTGQDHRDLLVTLDPIATDPCDHRYQAKGHDPGVKLRHLTQIRNATCTGPSCRRPSTQADFEHNIPYEAGGRSCLCNGGPKCRHDHRLKQHPRWKAEQLPDGTLRWTTPSGRTYDTEPTRYPV